MPDSSFQHDIDVRIDSRYLDVSTRKLAFRLETYRSLGTVSSASQSQLRCYFIAKCDFVKNDLDKEVRVGRDGVDFGVGGE